MLQTTCGVSLKQGLAERVRDAGHRVQERLANIISAGISPPLMPAIEVLPWRDKPGIGAEVFPSYSRPHHLVSTGVEEGTYIRAGASNRKADRQMREELAHTARNEAYDEQPLPQLSSEAIDFRAASELLAPFRAIRKRDLQSLKSGAVQPIPSECTCPSTTDPSPTDERSARKGWQRLPESSHADTS